MTTSIPNRDLVYSPTFRPRPFLHFPQQLRIKEIRIPLKWDNVFICSSLVIAVCGGIRLASRMVTDPTWGDIEGKYLLTLLKTSSKVLPDLFFNDGNVTLRLCVIRELVHFYSVNYLSGLHYNINENNRFQELVLK